VFPAKSGGSFRILPFEGIKDYAVLNIGVAYLAVKICFDPNVRFNRITQVEGHFAYSLSVGTFDEAGMKETVSRHPFLEVLRGGGVERLHHLYQSFYLTYIRLRSLFGGNPHRVLFHDHVELKYFNNFIVI